MEHNLNRPLIGLTGYRNLSEQGYARFSVSEAYTSSLVNAGAIPLMIPSGLSDHDVNELLNRLDGLVFTGGGDISPSAYGQPAHPSVNGTDLDRDQLEFMLVTQAIQRNLPFLGICRGLQVINVALGGDLYADILEQHPGALKHSFFPDFPREYLAHNVEIVQQSLIAGILGVAGVEVNSLHHQGIRNIAAGLRATALAPDGIIEAIELPGHPFGLAVQWHPENLQEHLSMREIFKSLVDASTK